MEVAPSTPPRLPPAPSPSLPQLDANTQQHCFTPIALSKAPRPWERRPSTPFAPRSKTHKVWKRYGLRSKEVDEKTVVSDRRDDNAAARAIKRLRADAREEGEDGEEGSEFFATRWDLNAEVGRRKPARHRTLVPRRSSMKTPALPAASPSKPLHDQAEDTIESSVAAPRAPEATINEDPSNLMASTSTEEDTIIGIQEPFGVLIEFGNDQDRKAVVEEMSNFMDHATRDDRSHVKLHPQPMSRRSSDCNNSRASSTTRDAWTGVALLGDNSIVMTSTMAGDLLLGLANQPNVRMTESLDGENLRIDGGNSVLGSDKSQDTSSAAEGDTGATVPPQSANRDLTEGFHSTDEPPKEPEVQNQTQERSGQIPWPGSEPPPDPETERVYQASEQADISCAPLTAIGGFKTSNPDLGEDMALLTDFLFQHKAKKAAIAAASPEKESTPPKARKPPASPMTRSRRALVELDSNSPSPQKPRDLSMESGTLPMKLGLGDDEKSESEVLASCRRSTRTQPSKRQRMPPQIPNHIPVRRSDGTEFIFLPKTEAQELALATRSNTKRNKGEAQLPKVVLQKLSPEEPETRRSPRKRKGVKQVSWDETIVHVEQQQEEEKPEVVEEKTEVREEKTPVKRARKLGRGNGTPAPKEKRAQIPLPQGISRSTRRPRPKS